MGLPSGPEQHAVRDILKGTKFTVLSLTEDNKPN